MGVAFLAALKALPALVDAVNGLRETYQQVQVDMVNSKYEKLRERVNEITRNIEQAETDEDRRVLVRNLNLAISE